MMTDIDTIDAMIDRRRLRSRLSVWRTLAFVAIGLALLAAVAALGGLSGLVPSTGISGPHVARVTISGVITEDRPLIEMLDSIAKDDSVEGVIVRMESPGGTAVGGEAIFEAVRKVSDAKPTTTSVGTVAASAGYMIASATDHIVARNASIVGSIGVILQYPQAERLLDKIGIEVKEIKSAPLKAEPSPFNATPPEAEAMLQSFVDETYGWFVDLVAERRPMDRAAVLRVADGSVFAGAKARELKLIDAVGGEDVARAWLTTKGIDADLPTLDWTPQRPGNSFFTTSLSGWANTTLREWTGFDVGARVRRVDAAMAVWQPVR